MTTLSELEAKIYSLMNKADSLTKQGQGILAEADALAKQLEDLQSQPVQSEQIPLEEFLMFVPKQADDYFAISSSAKGGPEINKTKWTDSPHDKTRLALGNVFCTERAARIIMENRATLAELKRLANFVPDWSDFNQDKWVLGWDIDCNSLLVWSCQSLCYSDSYFRTKKEALAAAEKVGDARIKQLRQYGV